MFVAVFDSVFWFWTILESLLKMIGLKLYKGVYKQLFFTKIIKPFRSVCMYVCVCVCVYIYIYIYIYMCVCVCNEFCITWLWWKHD